jgi:hypothetical protein
MPGMRYRPAATDKFITKASACFDPYFSMSLRRGPENRYYRVAAYPTKTWQARPIYKSATHPPAPRRHNRLKNKNVVATLLPWSKGSSHPFEEIRCASLSRAVARQNDGGKSLLQSYDWQCGVGLLVQSMIVCKESDADGIIERKMSVHSVNQNGSNAENIALRSKLTIYRDMKTGDNAR